MKKASPMIKRVAFADESDEVLRVFTSYGFNVKRDLKKLDIEEGEREEIRERTLDTLRDYLNNGNNREATTLHKSPIGLVSAIKMRSTSGNHRGKSGGFRIILICGIEPDLAVIFHIYPKAGSGRKDNISQSERNQICKLADELEEAVKRRQA